MTAGTEAIAKATDIANAAGFSSLDDMLAARPAKQKTKPKYRHPDNPDLTWNCRVANPAVLQRLWKPKVALASGRIDIDPLACFSLRKETER